jgi:hypothetical protein
LILYAMRGPRACAYIRDCICVTNNNFPRKIVGCLSDKLAQKMRTKYIFRHYYTATIDVVDQVQTEFLFLVL